MIIIHNPWQYSQLRRPLTKQIKIQLLKKNPLGLTVTLNPNPNTNPNPNPNPNPPPLLFALLIRPLGALRKATVGFNIG